MRLDDADDHVHALPLEPLALLQHLVGLADAGGEAEVDLEPAALLLADQGEELLGSAGGRRCCTELPTRSQLPRSRTGGRSQSTRQRSRGNVVPPPRLALARDLAAVGLHDLADDRQAQPRAAGPVHAGHAEELVEDVRQELRRDADAGVGDRQPHPAVAVRVAADSVTAPPGSV